MAEASVTAQTGLKRGAETVIFNWKVIKLKLLSTLSPNPWFAHPYYPQYEPKGEPSSGPLIYCRNRIHFEYQTACFAYVWKVAIKNALLNWAKTKLCNTIMCMITFYKSFCMYTQHSIWKLGHESYVDAFFTASSWDSAGISKGDKSDSMLTNWPKSVSFVINGFMGHAATAV